MAKLDYKDSDVIDAYKLLVGENSDPEVGVSSSEKRSRASLLDFVEFLFQTGVSNAISAQDIRALFHILIKSMPNEIDDQTNAKALANEAAITVINGSSSITGSITNAIDAVKANVPSEYDTLYKIANKIIAHQSSLDAKVDTVSGKGLSANDFTDTLKTKVDGIDASATANDTDANLKNRANHTGSQAISSVTNLQTSLDAKATQTEVDAIETGSGLSATGTYNANTSANYIDDATTLKDADDKLDAQVKTNADAISTNATAITSKVDDSQVLTDIPANALFTDTQLSDEQVQDKVAGFISGSGATTVTYDDAGNSLTISSTDTNTETTTTLVQNSNIITYTNELGVSNDINLASGSGEVNTASNLGTGSEVFKAKSGVDLQFRKLTAGANVTITENTNDITIASSGGGSGATYTISCVDGDNSDEEKIRLTGSDSTTDDIVLECGTGLSISRSGDKITFTSTVTDTNTQLSNEEVEDIVGAMVDGGTETNISVTYNDATGKLNFVSTDTTYSVGDGGLSEKNFTTALNTKLAGIATGAEVNPTLDTSPTTSTSNVVSSSGVKTAVDSKANLSDVLTKTNTTSFTPSANFHPATKKYVDDNASSSSAQAPVLTAAVTTKFFKGQNKTVNFQNLGHYFYPTHSLTNLPTGYSIASKTWTSPTSMSFLVSPPSTTSSSNDTISLSSHISPGSEGYKITFETVDFPQVGEEHAGGVVFYVDEDSGGNPTGHGLIIAKGLISSGFTTDWGCAVNNVISGADTSGIGTWSNGVYSGGGKTNTSDILAGCTESGIAAEACDDYSITSDGTTYSDWFLPSKDELNEIYTNKTTLENVSGFTAFAAASHWSSTEYENSSQYAWNQNFSNGTMGGGAKSVSRAVRPIRAY